MTTSRRRVLLGVAMTVIAAPLVYGLLLAFRAHRMTPVVVEKARALERAGPRIGDLPASWKKILLAVEDPAFYEHRGVDLSTPGAGLTTITQGLVKTHYFERFRPGPQAKLKQTVYALVLDREMSKDLQLTLLLHTANLGPSPDGPVVGFPAAAERYFGKPLLDLARDEFTTLVAMLIGPSTYHPVESPSALARRVERIHAVLAGDCAPADLGDVYYAGCS